MSFNFNELPIGKNTLVVDALNLAFRWKHQGKTKFVTEYAKTSTKSSGQITLSVAHNGSSTVSLKAASTSGSSTKVNVYRINLTRAAGSSSAVATLDSQAVGTARSIKYLVQTSNAEDGEV